MRHVSAESIHNEIVLLSVDERDKLYNQLRKNFYHNFDVIAYTADGESLTSEQYKRQVNIGIEQCVKGESISLEDLSKELGYNYADL